MFYVADKKIGKCYNQAVQTGTWGRHRLSSDHTYLSQKKPCLNNLKVISLNQQTPGSSLNNQATSSAVRLKGLGAGLHLLGLEVHFPNS